MNVFFLPLGLILPTLSGYLLLCAAEGKQRVLQTGERMVMGCIGGLTLTMLVSFAANAWLDLPLHFKGFLTVQMMCLLVCAGAWYMTGRGTLPAPALTASHPMSKKMKIVCGVLGVWIAIKVIITSVTFLILTPTYLDDTLDNWNLRGKVYFVDQTLTLVMPAEDPILSPKGVSSYAPTVPLTKTWLATIAGEWDDALINSIHVVWYIAAMMLLYWTLRRKTTLTWSLIGVYLLGSMPLYLMHGTNPYGDAFVSVHVFMALTMLFAGLTEEDGTRRFSFLRIAALMSGLLTFTKNEGLLVYLPPMLLILIIGLIYLHRHHRISFADICRIITWYAGSLIILGLPWLIFKWANGLTFGNAKPFTSLGLGWQENVLLSVFINTFFEGNWLLLFPLLFGLLLWRRHEAFRPYIVPSAFFLIVYLGQMMLFLFTGLSTEALRQTGYARGLVQMMPVIVLLTTLLLQSGAAPFIRAYRELAQEKEMQIG